MPVTIYSRYYGLGTVTIDGQQGLAQRPMPSIVEYPDGLAHRLKAGETLDLLAFVYYGREDLWWRIADANPGKFPLDWSPGDTVMIPPLRIATRTARR